MKSAANLTLTLLALLAFSLVDTTQGKSAHILDDGPDALDVPSIAKIVCNPGKKYRQQISRISTVNKLADYFHSVSTDHELGQCREKYGAALDRLQLVVSSHNENVCSEQKVSLIADFHKSYVSTVRKHKDHQRELQLVAPEILKTFFIQYASEVSSICERFATDLVQRASHNLQVETEQEASDLQNLDRILEEFSKKLLINDVKRYKDIYQLWTLVENLALEKSNKFSLYLSDGPTKIAVITKDAQDALRLRHFCQSQMKPIYSKSILPVLHLVDLGYYPQSTQFLTEIQTNSLMKRMYVITQYCEIILPVRVFENEALAPQQVVLLTHAEADQLPPPQTPTGGENEPLNIDMETSANSMVGVDKLELITSMDAVSLAKEVKDQIKHRSSIIKKLLKILLKALKHDSKSMSLQTSQDETDIAEELKPFIPELEHENLDKLYEDDQTHKLIRRRRGLKSILTSTFVNTYNLVVIALFGIIYFIFHICLYQGILFLFKTGLKVLEILFKVIIFPIKLLFTIVKEIW